VSQPSPSFRLHPRNRSSRFSRYPRLPKLTSCLKSRADSGRVIGQNRTGCAVMTWDRSIRQDRSRSYGMHDPGSRTPGGPPVSGSGSAGVNRGLGRHGQGSPGCLRGDWREGSQRCGSRGGKLSDRSGPRGDRGRAWRLLRAANCSQGLLRSISTCPRICQP
jgi:hypothetical protein